MIKLIKIVLLLIALITLTGCFKSWSKEEKQVLYMQSKGVAIVFSPKNPEPFSECFKNYMLENYSGKEYMQNGENLSATAIMKCKSQ